MPAIQQCGLERDLTLFNAGDATEVGEKGLTLRYDVFWCVYWSKMNISLLAEGKRHE
jgi:hypothetical protein